MTTKPKTRKAPAAAKPTSEECALREALTKAVPPGMSYREFLESRIKIVEQDIAAKRHGKITEYTFEVMSRVLWTIRKLCRPA
jgi:hypothetical protein